MFRFSGPLAVMGEEAAVLVDFLIKEAPLAATRRLLYLHRTSRLCSQVPISVSGPTGYPQCSSRARLA